ncbi:MAG: hypothetical protein AAFY15_05690 [Cyanobacteria bacterium J06648_11]
MRKTLRWLWIWLVGTIASQSLLTSLFALGWTYRWQRRTAVRRMFHRSAIASQKNWRQFASEQEALTPMRDVPRLFRRQPGTLQPTRPVLKPFHAALHGAWTNLGWGGVGILTTWTLTLLPTLLWSFAWYAGWHVSFAKMYEHSEVGISLGFSGLLLFSLAMLYLPIAQARHALTGDWRSFFDRRVNLALIWHRPLFVLLLALGYGLAGVAIALFKIMPAFFTAMNPDLTMLSAVEALQVLNRYYFWTGGIAIVLFVALRTAAARLYSNALTELWRQARVKPSAFHVEEVRLLELMQVEYGDRRQSGGALRKAIGSLGWGSYRGGLLVATALVWSAFNVLPFVSQFGNYQPVRGFLNQPLVQLPCFRYVPESLEHHGQALPELETELES